MKTFLARTPGQWRKWLQKHHDSEPEVWLIFYKRHTGVVSLSHEDALDEALCFGWIDSLVKRVDDSRYAIKFTPRKADSRWSAINRKRYKELEASGRLRSPGIKRSPEGRPLAVPPAFSVPSTVPLYIRKALQKRPAA